MNAEALRPRNAASRGVASVGYGSAGGTSSCAVRGSTSLNLAQFDFIPPRKNQPSTGNLSAPAAVWIAGHQDVAALFARPIDTRMSGEVLQRSTN